MGFLYSCLLITAAARLAGDADAGAIQLKFSPKGPGRLDDDYYEHSLDNICVACGSGRDLLRHHVIPKEYRSHFPDDYKSHSSHDIVALCALCAQRYSSHQTALKKSIMSELGVVEELQHPPHVLSQAQRAASALVRAASSMPASRSRALQEAVAEYLRSVVSIVVVFSDSQGWVKNRRCGQHLPSRDRLGGLYVGGSEAGEFPEHLPPTTVILS